MAETATAKGAECGTDSLYASLHQGHSIAKTAIKPWQGHKFVTCTMKRGCRLSSEPRVERQGDDGTVSSTVTQLSHTQG